MREYLTALIHISEFIFCRFVLTLQGFQESSAYNTNRNNDVGRLGGGGAQTGNTGGGSYKAGIPTAPVRLSRKSSVAAGK